VILYAPLIIALALLPLEPRVKAKPNADWFFSKDARWWQGGVVNTTYFYRIMYRCAKQLFRKGCAGNPTRDHRSDSGWG